MKPRHNCPACPSCKTPTGMATENHPRWAEIPATLTMICAACGHRWAGSPDELARAKKADAAWERKQLRSTKAAVSQAEHAKLERRLAELKAGGR